MYYYLSLIVLVILGFSFNREKKFIPPGTVQFNDTLYVDKTEVSNFSWREFEYWVIKKYGKGSNEHKSILPDTLVWRYKSYYNEPYVNYYYRHVAYKDYPVVGISYEQTKAYCEWRTNRVKLYLNIAKRFRTPNFEYRLPTNNEWEQLAELSIVVFNNSGKDKKGNYLFNFLNTDTIETNDYNKVDIIAPIKSYQKDVLGLYNMFGNVSEMVLEKGISKGGAWNFKLDDCLAGKNQYYTEPTSWLGFRCICVLKK
ncbi:MAG: SUMF1/EgtB/PvdO family nonheme iron enzyme [Bacteroidia bacterium]|nr:SUMF1/EgtB/PvdO family nonheme iron enzyme [Bacteroidia bacterium]